MVLRVTTKDKKITIALPYDKDIEISDRGDFEESIRVDPLRYENDFKNAVMLSRYQDIPRDEKQWNKIISYSRSFWLDKTFIDLGEATWDPSLDPDDARTSLGEPDDMEGLLTFFLPPSASETTSGRSVYHDKR